jgi:hypothetical protein
MKTSLNLSAAATKPSRFRMAGLFILILATTFAMAPSANATAIDPNVLSVTAIPGSQTLLETTANPLTYVTFAVTNKTGDNLILDYALETVLPAPGDFGGDDLVWNNGYVSAALYILAGKTGDYTFGFINPYGNPGDCCDNGNNDVTFYIEMSPMAVQPTSQTISTNDGYGTFIFPVGGASQAAGPNPGVKADLMACFNNPGPNSLNPCPAAQNEFLFAGVGVVRGSPQPASAVIDVVDTPEPSSLYLLGSGLLGLAGVVRRKLRRG